MTENAAPDDETPDNIIPPEAEEAAENNAIEPVATEKNETMEAHHHTHHHKKKNWKAYFWEFLMLFLAVFCGFLAEYQLEHVIEHNREKAFMSSLIEDLETDANQLQTYMEWRTATDQQFDSIIEMLGQPTRDQHAHAIAKLANNSILRFGLPDISERTILQLKNAGGLRLIRSKSVSSAINKHYMSVNRMKSVFETERFVRLKLMDSRANLFNAMVFAHPETPPEEVKLISHDEAIINHFINDILAAKQLNKRLIGELESLKKSSLDLKQLIEKEYPE